MFILYHEKKLPVSTVKHWYNRYTKSMKEWSKLLKSGTEPKAILQAWAMIPDSCTNYEQSHHMLLRNITTLKIYEKNNHNYSNLAQSQILLYIHQWPMVSDYDTQYEENPSSHHVRNVRGRRDKWTDWLSDWRTGPFPIFPDST